MSLRTSFSARAISTWASLLCGAFVITAFLFRFTADDGYILARYAENLVDRGELVFNPGERISAVTSPLHALLAATYYRVTGHTILVNKLVSLLLVGATAVWCIA